MTYQQRKNIRTGQRKITEAANPAENFHKQFEKPQFDIKIDWSQAENWNPTPTKPFNNQITWKVILNRNETLAELRYWQWKFKNRKFKY